MMLMAEAETPILWPPHVKSWLIGKDSDGGRDSGQEEKGMTEDEMAGWHHWLDGRESEWTPGVGDGQGGLACCDSWGRRVGHDWTTELNWCEFYTCEKELLILEECNHFYIYLCINTTCLLFPWAITDNFIRNWKYKMKKFSVFWANQSLCFQIFLM